MILRILRSAYQVQLSSQEKQWFEHYLQHVDPADLALNHLAIMLQQQNGQDTTDASPAQLQETISNEWRQILNAVGKLDHFQLEVK